MAGKGKAQGVELATAYVSVVASTDKLYKQVESVFSDLGRTTDGAGRDLGRRLAAGVRGEVASADVGGRSVGQRFARDVEASTRGAGSRAVNVFQSEAERRGERVGTAIGTVLGRGIGLGIKGGIGLAAAGATTAVGALTLSLTKGFSRLKNIDDAKFKLQALGNSTEDVAKIMKSAEKSVKGTAFGLDEAVSGAASAIAAGVKPGQELAQYLTNIGDAAAIAGVSFGEMAMVFNKVQAGGKAYTEDLNMMMERQIPIFQYLQKLYGVNADELKKMIEDGKVSAADFNAAVAANIGGAAVKMGESFSGSVSNMGAALGRFGAKFINSALGGNGLAGPTAGIGKLTAEMDKLGVWVDAHSGDIADFFSEVGKAALAGSRDVLKAVAELVGAFGGLQDFLGNILGGVNKFQAWIADVRGDHELAKELRAQAEDMFSWGDSAKEVEQRIRSLAEGIDEQIPKLDAWGEEAKAAGKVTNALGDAFKEVNANGQIILTSNAPEKTAELEELGLKVTELPDGSFAITPGTPEAQRLVDAFVAKNATLAPPATLPLQLDTTKAAADLAAFLESAPGQITAQFAGLNPNPKTVGGNPLTAGLTPLPSSGGAEAWRTAVRASIAAYGPQLGITNSKAWEDALVRQIDTESGGNPKAINLWDSNAKAGHPSQGLLQFIPSTFAAHNITGRGYLDPMAQIAAALDYVKKKYGVDASGAPNQIGRGVGYAFGGAITGPGPRGKDSVAMWGAPGEHVFTAADVAAMGGQGAVYAFRHALHRKDGGAIWKQGAVVWPPKPIGPTGPGAGDVPHPAGRGNPGQIGFPDWGPGTTFGPPPDDWWGKPIDPNDVLFPDHMPPGDRDRWIDHWWKRKKIRGYADGGAITGDEDWLKKLLEQGVEPPAVHGLGKGSPPGPVPAQLADLGDRSGQDVAAQLSEAIAGDGTGRTQGYIPSAAGSTSVAGTSMVSGFLNMGAEAVNSIIDQASSAVSSAVAAGIAGGSAGAGAGGGGQAGAAAAQFAIGMATNAAKRGVSYGAQMLGIGADALIEQAFPIGGPPRWIGYDYTQFVPNLQPLAAAVTTGEKATLAGSRTDPNTTVHGTAAGAPPGPGAPVQPGQMPGAAQSLMPPQTAPFGTPTPAPQPGQPGAPADDDWLKRIGVFDAGGVLPDRGMAVNLSGRPEHVLTGRQWDAMYQSVAAYQAPAPDPAMMGGIRTVIESVTVQDVNELRRQMDDRDKLAMMRYASRS